jgi:IS5 family transposase
MALGQMSFAEALMHPRMGANERLEAIDAAIDWAPLRRLAEKAAPVQDVGRRGYDALGLLKALYLQALYDLSDPGLGRRWRTGCRFGVSVASASRSRRRTRRRSAVFATRLWRETLAECLAEVNAQLDRKGLILRKGTLVDASLIGSASRKPDIEKGAGARLEREPGARWTRKNGRSHFGYRLHVGVDQGSKLIRNVAFTPANINDSSVADALISGDERAVYGDKGYESKKRRRHLRQAGIKDRICHRSYKHQRGLPRWRSRRNDGIAKRRAPVEGVFGTLKRGFGWTRARYARFAQNVADAFRMATVFNLRRAVGLMAST